MKIVCAWCGKYLGEKEPMSDTGTTHGLCQECLAKELKKIKGGKS